MVNFKFSLILPYFNESNSIDFTLTKLSNLKKNPDEILFIDSNSTDKSYEKINEFIKKKHKEKNWFNFKTNFNTPSESKNFGISKSKYNWCAFMDFDLNFDLDWTKKQIDFIKENPKKLLIFGQIKLTPSNYLDKLIIIQTWGINKKSPVVPSSFIHKNYFKLHGNFLPYRSYYDKIFINIGLRSKLSCINNSVLISYRDICYSNNLFNFIIKTINYSYQVVYINKIFPHYLYLGFVFLLLLIFYLNTPFFIFFIFLYLLLRSLVIPLKKNQNLFNHIGFIDIPNTLIIGVLYDFLKVTGYILGIFFKILNIKIHLDKFYK